MAASTFNANGEPVTIFGQPNSSSLTPGHDTMIATLARQLAASGKYAYVLMQRSWRTATGREAESGNIPDVIAVGRNGVVDAFEVASKTDDPDVLLDRLEAGMDGDPAAGTLGVPQAYRGRVKVDSLTTNGYQ